MIRTILCVAAFVFAANLGGCSVGMAMSGKKDPDLGMVKTSASRGEVEMQLGKPIETTSLPDGCRVDMYEYEVGNEPSAGRAIGHGVMDVLTLGLWEVVGTPIEGVQGTKNRVTITYDRDDRVKAVNQIAKPAPVTTPAPPGSSVSFREPAIWELRDPLDELFVQLSERRLALTS